MKMKPTLLLAAALAFAIDTHAQDQAPPDSTPPPTSTEATKSDATAEPPTKPSRADQWRTEVLAWTDAHRVEEGAVSETISEVEKPVLVLGTVDGNVSTVGRDVAVLGVVKGNVSSSGGTVTVLGTVDGRVAVVGGDLRLAGNVTGKKLVTGGKLTKLPAAKNESKSAVSNADKKTNSSGKWDFHFDSGNSDFSFKMEPGGSPSLVDVLGPFWFAPLMLVWRSGLLVLWLAVGCTIAALFHPSILRAKAELQQAPGRGIALGFLWLIVFWVLLIISIVLSFVIIGLPLLVVLLAFDLALHVFGMTVIFSCVGEWLSKRINHPNASIYAMVFAGACLLGLVRLIPILGSLAWFVAGLFGAGATLASRFGQPAAGPPPVASLPAAATA